MSDLLILLAQVTFCKKNPLVLKSGTLNFALPCSLNKPPKHHPTTLDRPNCADLKLDNFYVSVFAVNWVTLVALSAPLLFHFIFCSWILLTAIITIRLNIDRVVLWQKAMIEGRSNL